MRSGSCGCIASDEPPDAGAPEVSTDPPRSAEEEIGEPKAPAPPAAWWRMTLGALGVVFGDIGTSPLYALQTVFTIDDRAVRPDEAGVYGVISLVFWAVTLIVSIKYVTLIMRADNHGEGGIMALIALVQGIRVDRADRRSSLLVALGIFGASLFYGDGMITPAISVLSAVEGLEVAAPGLEHLVVPITLAIVVVLFSVQRFGTSVVGRAFGPVMTVWFAILGVTGLVHVIDEPGILRALSPTYGAEFLVDHGGVAFIALGAVVLTVTGAEALYADMGHFGRHTIRRAWFAVVFPALILNYMGQGALILERPEGGREPLLPAVPGLAADPDGAGRDGRRGDRLAGRDLRRVLGHPPGRPARLPAAADGRCTPRARSARSTCPPSTGASSSRSPGSSSASAPPTTWRPPTASP